MYILYKGYRFMADNERLLTVKDAAEFLNVSEVSIRRWTDSGKLECYRIGEKGVRRFLKSQLDKYLEKHKQITKKPTVG